MKMKTLAFFALLSGLSAAHTPLLAHHGAAAYNMDKAVVLKNATVTRYRWINPHALLFFEVKDDSGKVTQWTAETGSLSAISLMGWTRTTFKPGDVLTVHIFQSKTGKSVGRINKIELANGTVIRDTQTGGDSGERADDAVR